MKDVGYSSKPDPKSESFQTALRDLRRIIGEEIEKLLCRVIVNPGFGPLYRDYTGKLDYKTFEQKLLKGLEEIRRKEGKQEDGSSLPYALRILLEKDFFEFNQIDSQQEHEGGFSQILSLLLSPEYSPPAEWNEIVAHLAYLWFAWKLHYQNHNLLKDLTPLGDLSLLLSFSKLMGASYELLASCTMKGDREIARIRKAIQAKKEGADKRKGFVIAIYKHGLTIALGTKLNKACIDIRKQFKDWQGKKGVWGIIPEDMKLPHPTSIRRWLREDGTVERDFRLEGGYWIKWT